MSVIQGKKTDQFPSTHKPPPPLLGKLLSHYGLVLVLFIVVVLFGLLRPDTFFSVANARMIASTNAVLAILALAAIAPLVAGQFDLSIGFTLSLAQSLATGLILMQGLDPMLAIFVALSAGLLIGLLNGLLVAYAGLNAFITTLATGILIQGFTQWYTNGESIFGSLPSWFLMIGRSELNGIPLPLIYVIVIATALWLAYERTSWGRRSLATGGNERAALFSGVNVRRITLSSFGLAGFLSALAGVLSATILGSANPNVGGNYLLSAFAAVFLGATCIRPGRFNAPGTVIAVYTLAIGIAGLQQMGASFYVEQLFNGAALLAALGLAKWSIWRRATRASKS
ncbi:ABC transporter permease [Pusillimonas noertemannii]|uniref:ABC transporter permease n=1 Tax=Pusillimonas noertemannii TaxID=305977 RepID=UPI0033428B0F